MAFTGIGIRDFAIIGRLELGLESGLTVLTGETGAGKSIVVDALALVLGDRATTDSIRHGATSAEINACFSLTDNPDAAAWLASNELEADGECILRRIIYHDKATRAYINGRPVTVQALRELGSCLTDIHGQHEHQSLLRREVQRQILDDYAGLAAQLGELSACYQRYHQLEERHTALQLAGDDRQARIELLSFQVEELQQLSATEEEFGELEQEYARLSHASELTDGIQGAALALYDGDEATISSQLAVWSNKLAELQAYEPRLSEVVTLLEHAAVQVDEAAGELHRLQAAIDLDPQRLDWVQRRISALLETARKHRCQPTDLAALRTRLATELEELTDSDSNLAELTQQLADTRARYDQLARAVSQARQQTAGRFGEAVTEQMQELGLQGGVFEVSLEQHGQATPTRYGYDRIEFRVSANPGQPTRPLSRVASGGELSRISLAIQVIAAQVGRVPTLVFDEVDVGIGGRVAEIVGQKLRALSGARQVLCVTHLPQVAAQGHYHLRVTKQEQQGGAVVVAPLRERERVQEIARMLGGIEINAKTLAHAEDMLSRAAS